MDNGPRITAEADIGGRDESVVMDNFKLEAEKAFPDSVDAVNMVGTKLRLSLKQLVTLSDDAHKGFFHAQIRELFVRIGLKNIIIEETPDETEASLAPAPVPFATAGASARIASQATA